MNEFIIEDNKLIRYTGASETVVVPEGTDTICEGAFDNCRSLKQALIPSAVTEMEYFNRAN